MNQQRKAIRLASCVCASVSVLLSAKSALACGGFFCSAIPIVQAGEQVIFRVDGEAVTAIVLIQYSGTAEEFSWVVPVDGVPELSTGSDLVFNALELATRPQFVLEYTGEQCDGDFPASGGGGGPSDPNSNDNVSDDGVDILEMLTVGPFDVQIVSSDDPDALAIWLDENGYDVTDRGSELIAPYVNEGKNFVALKLRQNQGVGDIQPLIIHYQSGEPCVPIRLTSVAAQPDMGVLVWMLGPSRAIPTNYLHVTPNYTRLNWFSGPFAAYASYQTLITEAMNLAGGQGFATDYAGRDLNVLAQLPSADSYRNEVIYLSSFDDNASFVTQLANDFFLPNDQILEILRRQLPLDDPQDEYFYYVPELLRGEFSAEDLATARQDIIVEIDQTIINPLDETLAVFNGDPYLTRFYTTLSADEMTLDPIFLFNAELGDQALTRSATVHQENSRSWSLTLGAGTGREGERVIHGTGCAPSFFSPPLTIEQAAYFKTERLLTSGTPIIVDQKQYPTAQLGDDGTIDDDNDNENVNDNENENGSMNGGEFCTRSPYWCGCATIMGWNANITGAMMAMVGLMVMRLRRS